MRIGYLMQTGVPDTRIHPLSGPANHVKHIFDELRQCGHEVRLIAQFDDGIWKSDDLVHYDFAGGLSFSTTFLRLTERLVRRIQSDLRLPYVGLFDSLRFVRSCYRNLAGFDLLYERMGWMGYAGSLAARQLNIPLIFEVNGDHISEMEALGIQPKGAQRRLSMLLTQWAARQATHAIASGEGWRRKHLDRWNVEPGSVTTIENGSEQVHLLERTELRAFQTSPNAEVPITIVYVGAFEPWHGLSTLLRAFAKAKTKGLSLHLLLIGSGTETAKLKQLTRQLNVHEQVTFTGQVGAADLAQYLAMADIGVSPYCGRVEYSGLKLIDYKAAGLAIVASGVDGQPAVIEHGRTGWIVPPCDEDALCDALVMLCTNDKMRSEMGRLARVDAENCHSWRHTAEQLELVFERAITRHSSERREMKWSLG